MIGYAGELMEPFISRDGTLLFFNNSNREPDQTRIFFARRIDDVTFAFVGPVKGASEAGRLDAVPSMDRNGIFYFTTTRSYRRDFKTLYSGTFRAGEVRDPAPVEGLSRGRLGWLNMDAEISPSGEILYYTDNRFGGGPLPLSSDIRLAHRHADRFEPDPRSATILKSIDNGALVYAPSSSADGLELYFTRADRTTHGPEPHLYVATRTSPEAPFGAPERIAAAEGFVEGPSLSLDGGRLYFHRKTTSGFALFIVTRRGGPGR